MNPRARLEIKTSSYPEPAFIVGYNVNAGVTPGYSSVALGYNTQSSGHYSIAGGYKSKARSRGSVALGRENQAN